MNAPTRITQRQLRNDSGEILRSAEAGERFIVTRNGTPVAEIGPIQPNYFVPREHLADILSSGSGTIDYKQFRADVDAVADPTPRFDAWNDFSADG